jgi:peptide/nickel transport system substrate-binding protein
MRGDPAKARALLQGAHPSLNLCYSDTPARQNQANVVKQNLVAAGFQVTTTGFNSNQYLTTIATHGNTCDLYRTGWTLDWPSGGSMLTELFDGRLITPTDNLNLSYYNNPAVNQELDRIAGESDMTQAAADWAVLDKKIMTQDAPIIPIYDYLNDSVVGSDVGGAYLSAAYGVTSLDHIYLKSAG